jgi:hypothetical protein
MAHLPKIGNFTGVAVLPANTHPCCASPCQQVMGLLQGKGLTTPLPKIGNFTGVAVVPCVVFVPETR